MKARTAGRTVILAAATAMVAAAAFLAVTGPPLAIALGGTGHLLPDRTGAAGSTAATTAVLPGAGAPPVESTSAKKPSARTSSEPRTPKVPKVSKVPKASAPKASRAPVPASAPLRLTIPAAGVSADVTRYSNADVAAHGGAVKPPTLWGVSWWTGGGTPGTDADNTVYLYGHTWKEPAVFNRLKELRAGDRVQVTTGKGRLTYLVDGQFTVDKPGLPSHPKVRASVPGRLLLIGCYRETGNEDHTTENIVVSAHLL